MVSLRSPHPSRETLAEYHDGELDAQSRVEVRRHVLDCEVCREYLADLQSGSRLYQRLPAVRPPVSLRRDMDERLEAAAAARRRRWIPVPATGPLSAPNLAGLTLAAVLLVVLLPYLVGALSAVSALGGRPLQSAARPADAPVPVALPAPAPPAEGGSPAGDAVATAPEAAGGETGPAATLPEAPLVEPRPTVAPPTSAPAPPTTSPPTPTLGAQGTVVQEVAPAPRAEPTATKASAAPAAPAATATRRTSPAPAASGQTSPQDARQGAGQGTPSGAGPTGAGNVASPSPPAGGPAPSPPGTSSPAGAAMITPPPSPAAAGPPADAPRVVSGQISAVDRRQRLISVFAAAGDVPRADTPRGASRTWQVRLAETTRLAQKDGGALTFEDVGIADQVEVVGVESPQSPGTLTATTIKVLVSAVAPAANKPARVLVLLDGADALRPPQFGFTGDWIKRLNETGYAVTPLEPARISSGRYDLKEFNLIVIGYPATLSPNALQAVKASRIPILNAEPRLVQALGLGHNVDPQQPARDSQGKTVDIAGQASPITGGVGGETVLAQDTLHRMPIVAGGAVLGTVNDGGQKRAVWSVTGTTMYFGFWRSATGQNHNATYWGLFDRSVLWLLGRDPTTVPIPAP